jgi:hypothetical protein
MSADRCATWARQVDLDPAGTAPRVDVFVLVEHPLPWPADVTDDPLLARVERAARAAAGADRGVRVQAVAVDPPALERRAIVFASGPGPVRGYGRLEAAARPEHLPDLVASLVATEPPRPGRGGVTDVLICTHGSRDTCCGSLGTRLWKETPARGVRIWRTSHTGGHRFAPTAITFPDGCYWAFLDPTTLTGIVDQTLAPAVAADPLRGCAAFAPPVQVADRAVFAAQGWDWLARARFGEQRGTHRVELCFEAPDGACGSFDVCLEDKREMPVPACGEPASEAAKAQVEWGVTRVQPWTSPPSRTLLAGD